MKKYFSLGFIVLLSLSLKAQTTDSALVDSVKKNLPKGWTVVSSGNKLTVIKTDSVWFYNAINAPVEFVPSDNPPFAAMKGIYKIEIRYEKRWSDKAVKSALKSNADKLNTVYKKYNMDSIPNKMGDYAPRNADEEKRVAAYNKECSEIQKQLIEVPNAASAKYSYFIKSGHAFPGEEVWPNKANSEVAQVETLVNEILREFK